MSVGSRGIPRRKFLTIGGAGLAGAGLLGGGALAGCGVFQPEGGQSGASNGGGNIAVNLQDSIRGLDSAVTTDEVSANVLVNCMEGLQRLDGNDEPVPGQAESVDVSEDGLVYTFTLRDGIRWSDGSPVTSEDFRYAWLRAMDPETASQYAYIIAQFVKGGAAFNSGEGSSKDVAVEAPDEKTLRVTLEAPAPFWLGLTSFYTYYPQKQGFVEEQGEGYAQSLDALLFNGPYSLSDYNPSQGVTFVKRDDYWDADNVGIPRVQGRIVKEVDTAVNLFEAGDLAVTQISQEYVDEYRGQPPFYQQTQFSTYYLVFNEESLPIFRNPKVRRAFQQGFDREAMVREILNDGSEAATGFVPDGIAGPGGKTFREAVGPTLPPFDPQEARRLFEEGVREAGGESPQIELLSYETSTARDVATFLQGQFRDNLGAKVNVKIQPFDRKLELEAEGDFQLSFQGWGADYNDPMTFLDLWESGSPFNTGKYSNERYDRLVGRAKEGRDPAGRMRRMEEAEGILIGEDAGLAPLFFQGRTWLVDPAIEGYWYHNSGGSLDLKLYGAGG